MQCLNVQCILIHCSSLVASIKLVNQGCTLLSMTSHPIPLYHSCQSVLHCSVVNCITMVSRLFISSKLCHQSHQRCRSVQLTNSLTSKGWRLKLLNDNSCHQIINARPIVKLVDWELKMIEPYLLKPESKRNSEGGLMFSKAMKSSDVVDCVKLFHSFYL